MLINDFISRSLSQYASLSFFDSLRSTVPLYFFIAFLILYVGGMIGFLTGARGAKWVLVFCGIILFVAWSWIKLYQYYELKAPVKRKVFNYRLAQGIGLLNMAPDITVSGKGIISGKVKIENRQQDIIIRYSQDLWLNVGGIIPGTPVQTLRKINPRTWFLEIRGKTVGAVEKPVMVDFSARKNDDDPINGYGVTLYDPKTHAELNPKTDDPKKIAPQIRKAIGATFLKGSLTLTGNEFVLRIFDNIEMIRRWRRPPVIYKKLQNSDRPEGIGVSPEQAAFYGIPKMLEILIK